VVIGKKEDIISEVKKKIDLEKISGRKTPARLPDDYRYMPHIHQSTHESGGRDELDLTGLLGGGEVNRTPVTSDYTVEITDNLIECNGTFTVTLLAVALLNIGKVYNVKNVGTGVITVDGAGIETIDDELTQEVYQYDNMKIYTNGTEWFII